MKRIAINGFGRIGRLTFRILWEREDVEIVAINDLTDNATLAHLLEFDSAHGRMRADIQSDDTSIYINGKKVLAFSERDPAALPWASLEVDTVLECTGVFRSKSSCGKHLEAGAKKVLLSAPAKDDHFKTIVLGINEDQISPNISLYSNASCTTNCLAPMIKVLHENFTFEEGFMTTIHAYTSDQRLQDAPHSDLRRARAAAVNMIPTSTGAAIAVEQVFPAVQGKLSAIAVRVPVITGSMVDLTCKLKSRPSAQEINAVFKEASENSLKGILEYSESPLVSSDIITSTYSTVFDSLLTETSEGMAKVVAWYDNEYGYASRLAEIALLV